MSEFLMPSLGSDMEAGTLVEWLRKPGDAVKRGDVIAVVETEKGAIEIEIFETGVLEKLLIQPGIKVPVGTPLALISAVGAPIRPAAAPPPPPMREPAVPLTAAKPVPVPPAPVPAPSGARPLASPAARRRAAVLGVALETAKGTGPGGAIISMDVERMARAAAPPSPARPAKGADFAAMRGVIAAAMSRAKREIPHYYLSTELDIGRATTWLAVANAERPPTERVLLSALLVKALALAARATPVVNGTYQGSGFRPAEAVHVGFAVALRGGGLIAPAIHDADSKSLDAVMAALRDLVARARGGGLRSSELSDPTITLTSLGERGVEAVFPIIHPPQVAIIGSGKPVERPWVVDDRVVARPVLTLALAADHRVSDGHVGGLFLAEMARLLQTPEALR